MDPTNSIASNIPALRFPLFMDLTQKHIVVIGGGKVAARRTLTLLDFVGKITVIAPDIRPELEALVSKGHVEVRKRKFHPDDLDCADLVISATGVMEIDDWVWRLCREKQIPVNISADQSKCDFFFPGIARKGNLVAGVTASGTDHKLAKELTAVIRQLMEEISE